MFELAVIAMPLEHCRVVGRSKESRQARGAPGRSSIHTFSARAPSRRAIFSRFPHLFPCARSNDQSGKCAHGSMLGRETAAVRHAQKLASPFSGVLAISLFIYGWTYSTTLEFTIISDLMKSTAIYKNVMFIKISVWWFSKECWIHVIFTVKRVLDQNKNDLFFIKYRLLRYIIYKFITDFKNTF